MTIAEANKTSGVDRDTAPAQRWPRSFRWSGALYDQVVDAGIFNGLHIELINGEILDMSPMNEPHAQAIQLAMYALLPHFSASDFTIRVQLPMRLGESSRPEPDLALIPGTARQITGHPTMARLVIEVSDATLEFDREEKCVIYARSEIPEYWIINLRERRVEVRRNPISKVAGSHYTDINVVRPGEFITPLDAGSAKIAVADLLP